VDDQRFCGAGRAVGEKRGVVARIAIGRDGQPAVPDSLAGGRAMRFWKRSDWPGRVRVSVVRVPLSWVVSGMADGAAGVAGAQDFEVEQQFIAGAARA
jgi:hypothetical protein